MAPTIEVIVAGEVHSLDEVGKLIGHDGWGMAPMHRLESRGTEQHGSSDEGFRLDPRLGELIFRAEQSDLDALYEMRDAAMRLFSPLNNPILRWTFSDGRVREIACHYHSSLSLPWNADEWAAPKLAVTLKANDPTFYDPEAVALTFALGGGAGSFVVATPVPTSVGASTIDQTLAVQYDGTWQAQPDLIRLVGPLQDFEIHNETTGEVIQAKSGAAIADGDYYDITLGFGLAAVVDEAGASQIADLEDADDLTVWHLAANPEAPDGINSIRVVGAGANGNSQVEILFKERFLGV